MSDNKPQTFSPGNGRPHLTALATGYWIRTLIEPIGDDYQPRHRLDAEVEADA